jgi:hypothetical protein
MKEKFEDLSLSQTSLDRIADINAILAEYEAEGYDLSLRQLYYQLVFQVDKWADQDWHVEVMVEKQALEGVLIPVCERLDVPFSANKGYTSLSMLYEAGKRIARLIQTSALERPAMLAALTRLRQEWEEAADGEALYMLYGNVGLFFDDVLDALGLTELEKGEVHGLWRKGFA